MPTQNIQVIRSSLISRKYFPENLSRVIQLFLTPYMKEWLGAERNKKLNALLSALDDVVFNSPIPVLIAPIEQRIAYANALYAQQEQGTYPPSSIIPSIEPPDFFKWLYDNIGGKTLTKILPKSSSEYQFIIGARTFLAGEISSPFFLPYKTQKQVARQIFSALITPIFAGKFGESIKGFDERQIEVALEEMGKAKKAFNALTLANLSTKELESSGSTADTFKKLLQTASAATELFLLPAKSNLITSGVKGANLSFQIAAGVSLVLGDSYGVKTTLKSSGYVHYGFSGLYTLHTMQSIAPYAIKFYQARENLADYMVNFAQTCLSTLLPEKPQAWDAQSLDMRLAIFQHIDNVLFNTDENGEDLDSDSPFEAALKNGFYNFFTSQITSVSQASSSIIHTITMPLLAKFLTPILYGKETGFNTSDVGLPYIYSTFLINQVFSAIASYLTTEFVRSESQPYLIEQLYSHRLRLKIRSAIRHALQTILFNPRELLSFNDFSAQKVKLDSPTTAKELEDVAFNINAMVSLALKGLSSPSTEIYQQTSELAGGGDEIAWDEATDPSPSSDWPNTNPAKFKHCDYESVREIREVFSYFLKKYNNLAFKQTANYSSSTIACVGIGATYAVTIAVGEMLSNSPYETDETSHDDNIFSPANIGLATASVATLASIAAYQTLPSSKQRLWEKVKQAESLSELPTDKELSEILSTQTTWLPEWVYNRREHGFSLFGSTFWGWLGSEEMLSDDKIKDTIAQKKAAFEIEVKKERKMREALKNWAESFWEKLNSVNTESALIHLEKEFLDEKKQLDQYSHDHLGENSRYIESIVYSVFKTINTQLDHEKEVGLIHRIGASFFKNFIKNFSPDDSEKLLVELRHHKRIINSKEFKGTENQTELSTRTLSDLENLEKIATNEEQFIKALLSKLNAFKQASNQINIRLAPLNIFELKGLESSHQIKHLDTESTRLNEKIKRLEENIEKINRAFNNPGIVSSTGAGGAASRTPQEETPTHESQLLEGARLYYCRAIEQEIIFYQKRLKEIEKLKEDLNTFNSQISGFLYGEIDNFNKQLKKIDDLLRFYFSSYSFEFQNFLKQDLATKLGLTVASSTSGGAADDRLNQTDIDDAQLFEQIITKKINILIEKKRKELEASIESVTTIDTMREKIKRYILYTLKNPESTFKYEEGDPILSPRKIKQYEAQILTIATQELNAPKFSDWFHNAQKKRVLKQVLQPLQTLHEIEATAIVIDEGIIWSSWKCQLPTSEKFCSLLNDENINMLAKDIDLTHEILPCLSSASTNEALKQSIQENIIQTLRDKIQAFLQIDPEQPAIQAINSYLDSLGSVLNSEQIGCLREPLTPTPPLSSSLVVKRDARRGNAAHFLQKTGRAAAPSSSADMVLQVHQAALLKQFDAWYTQIEATDDGAYSNETARCSAHMAIFETKAKEWIRVNFAGATSTEESKASPQETLVFFASAAIPSNKTEGISSEADIICLANALQTRLEAKAKDSPVAAPTLPTNIKALTEGLIRYYNDCLLEATSKTSVKSGAGL